MDNENIKKIQNTYFEAIKCLQDEQDIIDALPKPEYEDFFSLMENLIEFINKELEQINNLITKENDEEMKEYLSEELNLWKFKLSISKKLIDEAEKSKKIEQETQITPNKKLIFATTTTGNIYLEKDLKDIPEECYDAVRESLEALKDGYVEENDEKGKQLKNNGKIAKVHEIKQFKVRVMYKILAPDTLYIIMTRMKKDNNSKKDRDEVIIRNKQTEKEFNMLKNILKDPTAEKQIIDENQNTYNYLFEYLKERGRR